MFLIDRIFRPLPVLMLVCLGACTRNDMDIQPRIKPFAENSFFDDGRSARTLPEGVVARTDAALDEAFLTGIKDGRPIASLPMPLTRELLEHGRQRYEIYCAVCHDRTGSGNGMIVQRGFPRPPSYHSARLRSAPIGHFVDVMDHGFGTMYSYADRVPAEDRWAIAAYIRALQLSENARLGDVPPERRQELENTK